MLERVISGGQTGVDRAALDVALELHIPCGGWCPRGRRAEDGPLDARYPLRESPSSAYPRRTEWNVRDSDATLILFRGRLAGGTALTARLARRYQKPVLGLDLNESPEARTIRDWLSTNAVRHLNIAGPRESERPGIYDQASALLRDAFRG